MRRSRLRPISKKVQRNRKAFDAVYAAVDKRSGGRCELRIALMVDAEGRTLGQVCSQRATDHHHLLKPRRSHHVPELIVALCRTHHAEVDAPYAKGRLVISPSGDGRFLFRRVYAPDKFAHRKSLDSAPEPR